MSCAHTWPKDFPVPLKAAGRRLDVVAQELLGPEFSRAQVQRLLKAGHITLDGAPARPAARVKGGQRLTVTLPPPEPDDLTPEPMALEVLFEDEHLIVVNKAPGLVVHPAPGHKNATLVHGLLHHCGAMAQVGGRLRPGIVHRLDKDTSGALVAAKNDLAHRGLVAAFADGRVDKKYLALVWGFPPARGEIATGIGRHPKDRKKMSSQGRRTKPASSSWQVVRRFKQGVSLLRVRIHTGRTHQIRVHLSEAGYPVVGDPLYGRRRTGSLPPGPVQQAVRAAGRQLLHALRLKFAHPVTGQRVDVIAGLPADFRAVLRALTETEAAREASPGPAAGASCSARKAKMVPCISG